MSSNAEWFDKFAKIPTLKTIQETLKLDPEDLDKAEHVEQKELLLWYYDRWLPVVAGKHFWREEIRYFKLLTDTQDVAGKQKVNCTVTSEAFGLLNYENYKQMWERQMIYKSKNGKSADFPKSKTDKDLDGHDIEYYRPKWSNSTSGQVKYAGWAPEAYTRMDELNTWVTDLRKEDAQRGKAMQKYALKIIQEKNKAKMEKKNPNSKKRSRKEPPKPSQATRKIVRIDE